MLYLFSCPHVEASFDLVICVQKHAPSRHASFRLVSSSRLKTYRRDIKPVKVRQRPRVLPFDPISELTKPAAQERNVICFFFRRSPTQKGEKKDASSPRRVFVRRREGTHRSRRGLLCTWPTCGRPTVIRESRRDATRVSLAKEPERRQRRTRESLSGGDVATELNSCATGVELLGTGTSVFLCKPVMVCHKIAREESRRIIIGRSP